MLKIKSNLNFVVALAAIAGLVFLVGCGDSQEKQQMTAFIQEFGTAVQEYAKAEDGQKANLEAKLNSLMKEWTHMKLEMGSELTPQVLEKLDLEYKKFAKEFKTLSGKS
jgi:outer membrane murein-binding lipoprotein Lpp